MVEFAIERLAAARASEDSARLLALQWQETGDREIPSKPNWPLYQTLDDNGSLLLVVARQDGRPVGFLTGAIYRHVNAMQELVCSIPTYFVEPGPTRALILSRMIDFALQRLADRGVFRVDSETTFENSAGRLWELKGFKPAKIGYSLKLKKSSETCDA
jgi:GNAT superfamily N-acetyltransferase